MEERGQQSGAKEQQREQAALGVERAPVFDHEQIEERVGLRRKQRQKQPLTDADQRREQDDRECGLHDLSGYQDVTSSRAGSDLDGLGSNPSILSGLSARSSSSS